MATKNQIAHATGIMKAIQILCAKSYKQTCLESVSYTHLDVYKRQEQYVLSAVMHADERNRAMSDALGQDVSHYHLHVVYIPVVEKQIQMCIRDRCTTITFMWSTFPSWKSKSCGRNAARINRW